MGSIYPTNARFAVLTDYTPAAACIYRGPPHPCEGWALINGKWEERWADVVCKAGVLSKADFERWFGGKLPPLPAEAFS